MLKRITSEKILGNIRIEIYVDKKELLLLDSSENGFVKSYKISSAKNGIGNREGSGQTPLGEHRISEKIGMGQPKGTIFKSRKPTGEIWQSGDLHKENLILTRIIRLEGSENGVNRGGGIDSFERYIYIHGTNCESDLGLNNVSHGCILMRNDDIAELFNLVNEGDNVSIS
jgi:lipoprotein-anchoring transpeptidase ErfK/SrfK